MADWHNSIKHGMLTNPKRFGSFEEHHAPSIRDQINTSMARSMSSNLDTTIKGALDAHWGVWSSDDLKRRCKLVTVAGSPVQTLYADDIPILEIYPLEVETVRTDTGWSLRATQNYRRLSVGKSRE